MFAAERDATVTSVDLSGESATVSPNNSTLATP
jgi:hypothetical protein